MCIFVGQMGFQVITLVVGYTELQYFFNPAN